MAGAYATFAARGKHCDTSPVTEILNSDGKVFKKYEQVCKQVMQKYTADTVNDILRGVMEPGGFGSALEIGQAVSRQDRHDPGQQGGLVRRLHARRWPRPRWSPAPTASGTPITLNCQTVGGVNAGRAFGSTVAGPLWGDSMKAIARWLPDEDFVRPGAAPVPEGSQVVPSTIDMTIGQAVRRCRPPGSRRWSAPSSTPGGRRA